MKLKFTLLVLVLNSLLVFSQDYEPIELAKKLFQTDFPEVKNYSKGEFEGHPNKNDIGENLKLSFRTLSQTDKTAVVNITMKDNLNKGYDTYLHFEKDKNWMITAFRGLAQTAILEQMVLGAEKMSENDIQKMLNISKKSKFSVFKSKEDFKLQIENAKLTIGFDDDIVKHFIDNKEKFVDLKNRIENLKKSNPNLKEKELSLRFEKELNSLLLKSYGNFHFSCESCFILTIGGIIDNTVGYFYEPDKTKIPETNPSEIIMIREIGDGWYMYKTT